MLPLINHNQSTKHLNVKFWFNLMPCPSGNLFSSHVIPVFGSTGFHGISSGSGARTAFVYFGADAPNFL